MGGSVVLCRRGFMALAAGAAVTAGLVVAAPRAAATTARQADAVAPGAPGAPSYFDLARKDCVGTAARPGPRSGTPWPAACCRMSTSPTIDNTNVSTLQYIVTDGSTFTDLQTRDMTYTVAADPTGMACTVTATDAEHGYRLITTYITDPARDTVLMRTRLEAMPGSGTNLADLICTHALTRMSTATAAAAAETRAATPAMIDTSSGSRFR